MKRVYKFPLKIGELVKLPIGGSKVLHVGLDPKGYVCLWTLSDSDRSDDYHRTFVVMGTGSILPISATLYVGTVLQGEYVWHCFECPGI